MAYDPGFDSAWLKWGQALLHAQTLKAEIDAIGEHGSLNPVLAFRTEYNAKRHGFGLIIEAVERAPARWCLLLGDIASDYRASLDHLAWALVKRGHTAPGTGKLTPEQEGSVYFPLCRERTAFNAEIKVPCTVKSRLKLPGVRRADSAKVRGSQPYRYSKSGRAKHALLLLSAINNGDKHRTLQPLLSHATRVDIEVTDTRDCEVSRLGWPRNSDVLEIDTELAYIPVRKMGPDPEIDVELRIAAEPTIGHRLAFEEWSVRTAMLICRMLVQFSEPPTELLNLGCDLPRLRASAKALGL